MAIVRESVEIAHVMTSDGSDGVDIPLESLSHQDVFNLELEAGIEFRERLYADAEAGGDTGVA